MADLPDPPTTPLERIYARGVGPRGTGPRPEGRITDRQKRMAAAAAPEPGRYTSLWYAVAASITLLAPVVLILGAAGDRLDSNLRGDGRAIAEVQQIAWTGGQDHPLIERALVPALSAYATPAPTSMVPVDRDLARLLARLHGDGRRPSASRTPD